VINSPSFVRGRFGIGVETIGDIDRDGFNDVAISAPYQEDGRVYVYRGSPTGLVTDLYQVHAQLAWRGVGRRLTKISCLAGQCISIVIAPR